TIYLDIEPSIGLERARGRGALDRIEQLDIDFFHRTRERYVSLVKDNPKAVLINAEPAIEQVSADIQQAVEIFLTSEK
ncbi:thymidylate kinase family protein, partial [Glaesserella parasuis 29755]